MPRGRKAYTPPDSKMDVNSRDLCTQLNNYQKEIGMEPYFGIYRCTCCGHWYTSQINFYKTPSPLYEKNNGYLTVCKGCAQNLFDEHCKKHNNDLHTAMRLTCHELDWPYDEESFDMVTEKTRIRGHLVESYAAIIGNVKYTIGLSYSDTMEKELKEPVPFTMPSLMSTGSGLGETTMLNGAHNNSEHEHELLLRRQKALRFFGKRFTEEQLDYLMDEYEEWEKEYDCKKKASRDIYKNICLIDLKIYEGTATKDDIKSYQDLMDSSGIKPKQQIENALAEQNTLGTLIKFWEDNDPIPEPAKEWADVDNIWKYITTWFHGHLSEMFHFQNDYAELYRSEKAKYSVEPPKYEDEDLGTDISNVMFKPSASQDEGSDESEGDVNG